MEFGKNGMVMDNWKNWLIIKPESMTVSGKGGIQKEKWNLKDITKMAVKMEFGKSGKSMKKS